MSSASVAGDSTISAASTAALVSPPPPWWDMLFGVAHESRRVISAHSRHFLALTVLYLLPLSSLLIALPSVFSYSLDNPNPSLLPPESLLMSHHLRGHVSAAAIVIPLLCYAAALCAAAAIPASTRHGFFGRPVKLIYAHKSIPRSLPRLLSTLAAASVTIATALTLIFSILVLPLKFLSLPHLPFYFIFFAIALSLILYLLTKWSLAIIIPAMESAWWFDPLRRSAELTSGMRCASFSHNLFFAITIGIILWEFSLRSDGESDDIFLIVARTVVGSASTAILLLYWLVSGTVLYMYCKAMHGELAEEIAEEFAWEYVCLPFDREKVPHIISVIQR